MGNAAAPAGRFVLPIIHDQNPGNGAARAGDGLGQHRLNPFAGGRRFRPDQQDQEVHPADRRVAEQQENAGRGGTQQRPGQQQPFRRVPGEGNRGGRQARGQGQVNHHRNGKIIF